MNIDWSKSMEQTFEYYEVDPLTWSDMRKLDNIKSSSVTRDEECITLGSASIEADNMLGEGYVRIYLVVIQNGFKDRVCLGTFLIQTPSSSYDGKIKSITMDAYTPLLELKEKQLPLGYSLLKGQNILEQAYLITRDKTRAPVVETKSDKTLINDFVANSDDTSLSFTVDLLDQAKYGYALDDTCKILFAPKQELDVLQPVWTYNDDNSSILLPELNLKHDIYGIPNVVEVVCTVNDEIIYSKVVNNDSNSPTSVQARGREITYRDSNPGLPGYPTQSQVDEYARMLLKELNSVEYEVSYSHGYCPVRLGDCVRLNYEKAGLHNVKAKVIRQNIKCETGCQVSETAVFNMSLWK